MKIHVFILSGMLWFGAIDSCLVNMMMSISHNEFKSPAKIVSILIKRPVKMSPSLIHLTSAQLKILRQPTPGHQTISIVLDLDVIVPRDEFGTGSGLDYLVIRRKDSYCALVFDKEKFEKIFGENNDEKDF